MIGELGGRLNFKTLYLRYCSFDGRQLVTRLALGVVAAVAVGSTCREITALRVLIASRVGRVAVLGLRSVALCCTGSLAVARRIFLQTFELIYGA